MDNINFKNNIAIRFAEWLSKNEWVKKNYTHPNKVGKYFSNIHCEYKSIDELFKVFYLESYIYKNGDNVIIINTNQLGKVWVINGRWVIVKLNSGEIWKGETDEIMHDININ